MRSELSGQEDTHYSRTSAFYTPQHGNLPSKKTHGNMTVKYGLWLTRAFSNKQIHKHWNKIAKEEMKLCLHHTLSINQQSGSDNIGSHYPVHLGWLASTGEAITMSRELCVSGRGHLLGVFIGVMKWNNSPPDIGQGLPWLSLLSAMGRHETLYLHLTDKLFRPICERTLDLVYEKLLKLNLKW